MAIEITNRQIYLFEYFLHIQTDALFNFSFISIARGSMKLKMVVYQFIINFFATTIMASFQLKLQIQLKCDLIFIF